MPRPIGDVLHDLDQLEAEVPAGLAEDVWNRLFTGDTAAEIHRRRRPPWFFLTAAAAVIALLATAAVVVLPTDDGALAIVRRAKEQFRGVPSLSVVVARTVQEESSTLVVRTDYESAGRWRTEVLEDTTSGTTGDVVVTDGIHVGSYSKRSDVFRVEPIDAARPTDPLSFVSPDQMSGSEQDCRFVDEQVVAGRKSRHIGCAAQAIPGEVEAGERTEAWFDAEHGTLLRILHPNGISHEVRSIEYGVDHPESRFGVVPPQGAQVEWAGEGPAPVQFAPRRPAGPLTTVVEPDRPGDVVVTPSGEVWVALHGGEEIDLTKGRIARLDAATGEVREIVPVPPATEAWPDEGRPPRQVASVSDFGVIGDTLYVFDGFSYLVHRFDLRSRRFAGEPLVAGSRSLQPIQMLVHEGSVWMLRAGGSGSESGQVVRLADDGSVTQSIPYGAFSFGNARFGLGSLWIPVEGALLRIDPATGATIARISVPRGDNKPLPDETGVWLMSSGERGQVLRIDPATNAVTARIDMPGMATAAVMAGGRLWVLNPEGSSVTQIDPATNSITTRIDVGLTPYGIAAGAGAVWITVRGTRSIVRLPV